MNHYSNHVILVIAAHPDDEILGCGGAVARLASEGSEIHILIMAEGLTSRDDQRNRNARSEELQELSQTAQIAGKIIGAASVQLLDFPDNRMDSVDRLDVIKQIEKKIDQIKPSTIFTHFPGDLNIDHRVISDAVVTACRPYPGQSVKQILFFEVPSSTEWQISANSFMPNYFISLSNHDLDKKTQALEIYKNEMREYPHSRSIEAVRSLSKWRGASVGHEYAEAFMLGRMIN